MKSRYGEFEMINGAIANRLMDERAELLDALAQSVSIIRAWHGDVAFDIYYGHSPEMKLIRDALAKRGVNEAEKAEAEINEPDVCGAWFRVEVSNHDGIIVAIEPEILVGRDIGKKEEACIRKAIRNLCGFIGSKNER